MVRTCPAQPPFPSKLESMSHLKDARSVKNQKAAATRLVQLLVALLLHGARVKKLSVFARSRAGGLGKALALSARVVYEKKSKVAGNCTMGTQIEGQWGCVRHLSTDPKGSIQGPPG